MNLTNETYTLPTALALCVFVTVAALLEPAKARTCKQPDNLTFVQGKRHCLAIKTFHGTTGADTLFVVLHGDLSRGGPADYIFPVGEAIAQRGMPAVVMMRPGYTGDGRTSTGRSTRSQRRGEVYLKSEMDSIAVAVAELKAHHEAERVVMVGHSGGALISGVLLGRKPDLVDAVVLIACPCDVPRWRRVRGRRPLTLAQSPHKWLERVAADAKIFAITGSKDKNTFPDLARDYVDKATARGLDAEFVLVRGAGHGLGRRYREPFLRVLDKLLAR